MKDYKYADCLMTFNPLIEKWIAYDWNKKRIYYAGEHKGIKPMQAALKAMKLNRLGPWRE